MPLVRIEIIKGKSDDYKKTILDAAQRKLGIGRKTKGMKNRSFYGENKRDN